MSAPTIGNVTTGVSGAGGTYSFSHNSNSDLLLVLISTGYSSAGGMPTSVTYNGVAMTLLTSIISNGARTGIYYLKSPATGANNVTVTISGDGAYGAGAVSVIGADLTTTFGTPATANGNSTSPSVSVATTTTNDIVVACLAARNVTNPTDTATLSGTTLYNTYTAFGLGDSFLSGNSAAGTGSAVAMSATITTALDWSMCAVAIAGAAGGGGGVRRLKTVVKAARRAFKPVVGRTTFFSGHAVADVPITTLRRKKVVKKKPVKPKIKVGGVVAVQYPRSFYASAPVTPGLDPIGGSDAIDIQRIRRHRLMPHKGGR